jgi:VWFA-related protein
MTTPWSRAALIVAACAAAWVVAPAARAQEPSPSVSVNQVDAGRYPELRAVVTVLGADGLPVRGLTAAQFHADDGGAPVPVTGVTAGQDSSLGLTVILAIDVSGSMTGPPLANAKAAALEFIRGLGPNDRAAVLAFSDAVRPVAPVTADKAQIEAAVSGLEAGGATALYDAVQAATALAAQSDAPRRAVILLTDGEQDAAGSTATALGSIDAARASRTPVFTVGFGASPDEGYLHGLATATQGQYTPATSLTVADVYRGLGDLLRSQYVVTLRHPAAADGGEATLRIAVDVPGAAAPVAGTASFTRGVAPPAPRATTAPVQPEPQPAREGSSGTSVAAIVVVAVVAVVVLAVVALVLLRVMRRRRTLRAQERITAENPQLARKLGVPAAVAPEVAPNGAEHQGRLLALDRPGTEVRFGERPVTIGYDASCEVRVERTGEVAPRHAQVWMRDGKMMLRHIGGARRTTLVGGRPVEWVILEDGDEVRLGPWRWRAERVD